MHRRIALSGDARGGAPVMPYMAFGDIIRIDMQDDGKSVFGAIQQKVANLSVP